MVEPVDVAAGPSLRQYHSHCSLCEDSLGQAIQLILELLIGIRLVHKVDCIAHGFLFQYVDQGSAFRWVRDIAG